MDEVSIEQARPKLGDLVRDAQQHGITTLITRNGKPAAVLVPVGWYERKCADGPVTESRAIVTPHGIAELLPADWPSRQERSTT